jgi:hypothetical protein
MQKTARHRAIVSNSSFHDAGYFTSSSCEEPCEGGFSVVTSWVDFSFSSVGSIAAAASFSMVESGLQAKKKEGVFAFGYQKISQSRGWIEFKRLGKENS